MLFVELAGLVLLAALGAASYFCLHFYRLYTKTQQQQDRQSDDLAALHLRTIEALAMAIEAKDECTSEHLRRVQVYSLQVAEHLALTSDDRQALQTASILHDIGKLAVPDHIISKPGKLTREEFEKMKIHTVVGAAILEQVGFPYAVPAIVRSHHERWDGSGYPDGLKGEEIPIGARILSAVDFFDALASDRQYRPALPLDEALNQLVSLAGKSFDPRVVEVLQKHYREFEQMAQNAPLRETRLDKHLMVSRGQAPQAGFERTLNGRSTVAVKAANFSGRLVAGRNEVHTLIQLTRNMTRSVRLEDTLATFGARLKQLVPYHCLAVYVAEGSNLKPRYVEGRQDQILTSLTIPIGQGLSGWVVENRKPIVNGNPSVEPGYLQKLGSGTAGFRSAISVPLGGDADEIRGALTLYSDGVDAFSRDHLRIVLGVSETVSRAIKSALDVRPAKSADLDELTGIPNVRALFSHIENALRTRTQFVVTVCDLDGFKQVNDRLGHLMGNKVLQRIAQVLQQSCGEQDYVARLGGDEFVVVFGEAGEEQVENWRQRVKRLIEAASAELCGDYALNLSMGSAIYPRHGKTPEALIRQADAEMQAAKRSQAVV